jgi:hypothetical protein
MLGLAGCAPAGLEPASVSKIKTVGVIVALGDQLNYEQVAITAFGNDEFHAPAQAYAIDRYTADIVEKKLAGQYDVRPVAYEPADFQSDKVAITEGEEALSSKQPIGEAIRAKAKPSNLDAYVIVTPITAPIGDTNQNARGIGMVRQATIFGHRWYSHALYGIAVIDGHSGKIIAWQGKMGPRNDSYEKADETFWPEDHDNVPPDQAKKLAAAIKQGISDSMTGALQQAGLLPE